MRRRRRRFVRFSRLPHQSPGIGWARSTRDCPRAGRMEDPTELYLLVVELLIVEWRAGRRSTQETGSGLRGLGGPSPEERSLRHWRRVVADDTMTALRWLLRAVQPLQSWAMSTLEPQLEQLAATREAVSAIVGAYLINCWRTHFGKAKGNSRRPRAPGVPDAPLSAAFCRLGDFEPSPNAAPVGGVRGMNQVLRKMRTICHRGSGR